MGEMTKLGKDEETLGDRTLNFIQLFAKVLHKNFLQASGKLYRFFTDEFEALIQLFQSVFRDERPSFQGFFDFRVFGHRADFFVEFGGPLSVLAYIAEKCEKNVFRVSSWHDFLLRRKLTVAIWWGLEKRVGSSLALQAPKNKCGNYQSLCWLRWRGCHKYQSSFALGEIVNSEISSGKT